VVENDGAEVLQKRQRRSGAHRRSAQGSAASEMKGEDEVCIICQGRAWWGGAHRKDGVAAVPHRKSAVACGSAGGRMVLRRDEGGVEVLKRCGFMEEEEMCGGMLDSRYVEAEREEGRERGPQLRHVEEERGGGSRLAHTRGGHGRVARPSMK
jgi:hypothetical protein